MTKKGFTLIELLVVMAILGILATVGLNSFRSAQYKARDARRKSDLNQIAKALEMYMNDKGVYPETDPGGTSLGLGTNFSWGSDLTDPDNPQTIYMKDIPNDPSSGLTYCYFSDGTSYILYARLENSQDANCINPDDCGDYYTCDSNVDYNYGVSSSNTSTDVTLPAGGS